MKIDDINNFLKQFPFSKSCEIVHIDECGLVAVNKKATVMSHPNPNKKDSKVLVRAPYNFKNEYFSVKGENGEKLHLHLINRLDSQTSGLILLSVDEQVAQLARKAFRDKKVFKQYLAVCIGRPMISKGVFKDYITTNNQNNRFVRSKIETFINKFNAECEYNLIKTDSNNLKLSLIELKPKTGKTHQLRIQCANKNLPILGDATYGNFMKNKELRKKSKIDRLFLHCQKISLELDLGERKINFQAECNMPESFSKMIDYNPQIILSKLI